MYMEALSQGVATIHGIKELENEQYYYMGTSADSLETHDVPLSSRVERRKCLDLGTFFSLSKASRDELMATAEQIEVQYIRHREHALSDPTSESRHRFTSFQEGMPKYNTVLTAWQYVSLLYMQSELHELERQLENLDKDDLKDFGNENAQKAARMWQSYSKDQSEVACARRALQCEMRGKVKEYCPFPAPVPLLELTLGFNQTKPSSSRAKYCLSIHRLLTL